LIGVLAGVGLGLIIALGYGCYKWKNMSNSNADGIVYGEAGASAEALSINAPDEQPLNYNFETAQ